MAKKDYTYEQSLKDRYANSPYTGIGTSLGDAGLALSSSLFGSLSSEFYGQSNIDRAINPNNGIKNAVKNGLMMSPAELQNALLNQELSLDAYNKTQSFQAQRAQMEEAGLNPALMYGFSGGMNSSGGADVDSVSTGSAVAPDSPMTQLSAIVGAISDTIGTIQGIRKNNAEIENIKADTEAKTQENAARPDMQKLTLQGMEYDNASKFFGISESFWDSMKSQFDAKMAEIDADWKNEMNRIEANRLEAMTKYYNATSDKERREIKHMSFNEWIAANELELSRTKLGQEILMNQHKIVQMAHENHLFDAQAMNQEQQAFTSAEQANYTRTQNDYYSEQMFINYITAASAFTNAYTGAVGMSLSVGKSGLSGSGYNSKRELRDNLTGTVFQSIQDLYGDSGFYHRSNGKWFTLTPDVLMPKDGPLDAQWFVDHGYRWDSLAERWEKTSHSDRRPTTKNESRIKH